MSSEKMREEFEAATLEIYANADLVRKDEGYRNPHIQSAWWAWQASRAAIEVELPSASQFDDPSGAAPAIEDFKETIKSLGLKVRS